MTEALAMSCRRTSPRQRVIMAATLFTSEGVHAVRVRDLSPSGAKLIASHPIKDTSDAIFKRGSLFAAARVVWTNGCEAGLEFYRPLKAAEMPEISG